MRKPHPSLAPLALAALLAWAGGLPAQAQPAPATVKVSIGALPLGQALNELARQADLQLSFPADQVAGKTAPAVSGDLTVRQALDRLLAGSGLQASVSGSTVIVRPAGRSGARALPAVTVLGTREQDADQLPQPYAGGQVARGGRVGLLGNTDFLDTPFNQTSYTAELIENQHAQTLADVLINDPAVQDLGVRYGPTSSGMVVRGFSNTSNLGAVTFNGMQAGGMYKQSAELYERVEIIKGLDAMLNGMSPGGYLGGSINLVPKRAENTPLTRLTASYIGNAQFGGHLDFGRRFGQDQRWGIRVNALYRDGETPWNDRDSRVGAQTIGLDFRGERLRASLDVLHQNTNIENSQPLVSFAGSAIPSAPSPDSPILRGQVIRHEDTSAVLRASYDFNDSLSAFAGASRSWFRGANAGAAVVTGVEPDGSFIARLRNLPYSFDNENYQAGLRAAFTTGPISHRAVLSMDYLEQRTAIRQGNSGWGDWIEGNIYSGATAPRPSFDGLAPWEPNAASHLSSIALADTLSFNEGRVQFTGGMRSQRVKDDNLSTGQNYDERAVTPMAGLVVKPWTGVSLYANYIEGLQQGVTVSDPAAPNYLQTFPPYRSKQVEAGAKWDLGRLATTLSVFQISQPSLLQDSTGRYGVDGKQRNRGVEWSVFGQASRGLTLLGGLSYTQAELVSTAGGANDGNWAAGVARLKMTLGADWAVPGVSGLSLNGRVIHTGPAYLDAGNTQHLGGWTRFDAGARYATRIGGTPVTLRAGIENLFNRGYWIAASQYGDVVLSAPRTLFVSATVSF